VSLWPRLKLPQWKTLCCRPSQSVRAREWVIDKEKKYECLCIKALKMLYYILLPQLLQLLEQLGAQNDHSGLVDYTWAELTASALTFESASMSFGRRFPSIATNT